MAKKLTGKKNLFATISKVEKQEDGTLKVFGIASTANKDSDGETVTADCMKNAIPDYMKFGAVREMHQPMAAGTAISAEVNDAGETEFAALVVDPIAITKVETGVYKGFSIGGKVTERDPLDKSIIKGLNLIEVSLVDRPANPDAVITMYKAAKTQEDEVEELAELLDNGDFTPGQLLELAHAAKAAQAAPAPTEPAAAATPTPLPPTGERESEEDTAAKAASSDTIQKSMWDVGRFAELLQGFAYLAACSEEEMQWEGDGSAVPEALRQWLAQGVEIFKAMANEEANEMMQWLGAMVVKPDVLEAAAKCNLVKGTDTIAKAGAKFSKATKAALRKVHDACKAADVCLTELAYEASEDMDEDDAGKAADTNSDTDGISKTEVVLNAEGFEDLINKALAPVQEQLTKVMKENETLKAQVTDMGKRAAPGKALLKHMAITKSEDTVVDEHQPAAVVPPEGTPERAQYEMKKALGQGGLRFVG